ncbi:MAG TPA: hypothetical protein VLA09_00790, partial [Longimicrobiales bacterium]|nr:hypothetical protein [Longimicrobiales bacterium]
EVQGTDELVRFQEAVESDQEGPVRFERTGEGESVIAHVERDDSSVAVVVIAGRQIQTAEGLEVLGLGAPDEPPDGMPLEEAISATVALGAVPVLPWGFGKWTFGRRRVVERAFAGRGPGGFLVADTAHRPTALPRPTLLGRAEAQGIPVLNGSDPVPLRGEDRRPGSSCFVVTGPAMDDRPARWAKRALGALDGSPPSYQRPQSRARCAYRQIALQLRKRAGGLIP